MIEVRHLVKQFGETKALDDITFQVEAGEILGFLGPNGAGKTTTMRIITGLLAPTSGSVFIDGKNVQAQPLETRKMVGYLPESVPVYRDMFVEDYLRYVAALKGVSAGNRVSAVNSVIDRCGLEPVRKRLIRNLSKGFRQRVGLGQALVGDPKVLILDEPTEGLDPKQIIEIRNLIRELRGSRTILLSTHILPEVSMTCERVIIMNKGKLVAVDSPENLNRSLQNKTIISVGIRGEKTEFEAVLNAFPDITYRFEVNKTEPGVLFAVVESSQKNDIRSTLAQRLIEKNLELIELHSEALTLEDIFIQLVTDEQKETAE